MNPFNLETGDVLHCTGHGLLARLIMFATKSRFSHTAIFIEIWGQPYIIEAQSNGVNVKSYDEWLNKYGYTFEAHRNPNRASEEIFSVHAMSKVGVTGYDFVSLLIRKPIQLITGKWRKIRNEDDKMYCSEYAMWAHRIEQSYRMSPEDVFEFCKKNNWQKIV